jgi:hypothetical protein
MADSPIRDFEQQLRETLQRRDPPRDLTASVMAQIEQARPKAWGLWRWVPAAAGIAALLALSLGAYRWEQVQKGQQAKRQLMLALDVTKRKLAVAEKKVNELNHRRIGYE